MTVPFATSARSSVGLEWELMLADGETGDLVPRAPEVLGRARGAAPRSSGYTVTGELLTNTVEVTSGIGDTVAAAVDDIADAIAAIRDRDATRWTSSCSARAAIRSRSGTTSRSPTRRGTTSSSSAPSGGGAT